MDFSYVFEDNPIDESKLSSLQELFDRYARPNRLDVISGMSGGRDSIYQAFLLSQILKRKTMCFSWANDFVSSDARNALFSTVSELRSIQSMTFSLSQDVYGLYFRSMHKVFKRFCFCAHTMLLKAFPYAIEHEIPFICVGYSPDQINGKKNYSYGSRENRIMRIREYVLSYREMVLYAIQKTSPDMMNEVDRQLFGDIMDHLDKLEKYDTVPGLLMLAEYMPWKYTTVQKVVYDVYGLKKEGKSNLHSNCIYEPIRGYVEYIMDRPFLKKELEFIKNNGGLSEVDAKKALKNINYTNQEPESMTDFLKLTGMDKNDFYSSLKQQMEDTSLKLLSDFVNSMTRLQGYRVDDPIKIIR